MILVKTMEKSSTTTKRTTSKVIILMMRMPHLVGPIKSRLVSIFDVQFAYSDWPWSKLLRYSIF